MEARGLQDSKLGNLHIIKRALDFYGNRRKPFPKPILISHLVNLGKYIYFFQNGTHTFQVSPESSQGTNILVFATWEENYNAEKKKSLELIQTSLFLNLLEMPFCKVLYLRLSRHQVPELSLPPFRNISLIENLQLSLQSSQPKGGEHHFLFRANTFSIFSLFG